jgi:hypothetical protein
MMKNLTIQRTFKITVGFTADQWELYRDVEVAAFGEAGAETYRQCAATALNVALSAAVNNGDSRSEVERKVYQVMRAYSQYGAQDTEPRYLLGQALNQIFGEEE